MTLDTLTHAISGALIGRATAPQTRANTLSLKERSWVGFLAGAAPDLDAVIALFGPVAYLTHHRGESHSLLLMPIWAGLLALAFAWVGGRRLSWKAYYGVCFMALGIHILGDLITSYGTQILAPVSTWAPGLNSTFIIDPWFSAILLGGLLLSVHRRSRAVAACTLLVIVAVVALQYSQYRKAVAVGEAYAAERGISADLVQAYPQPLSWFNWKLVVVAGEIYHQTRVNLLAGQPRPAPADDAAWLKRLRADYQPVDHARWTRHRRFGDGGQDPLARAVWAEGDFAFYRRFAALPLVYGVETLDDDLCVWFYDLRFTVMDITPPFRFGMCRPETHDGGWRLHRLGAGGRQAL
ncbi:MAG: metal-dependent hydrolase [Aquisalimonadaceae bacterium]